MKKLFLLVLVGFFVLAGCSGLAESSFTIEVSGTSRLEFSGNYMTVTAGGDSTGKSVDGTVPARYTIKGSIVSCVFQKQSEHGSLKVRILKDGRVVSESESSAAYGVVSAATH